MLLQPAQFSLRVLDGEKGSISSAVRLHDSGGGAGLTDGAFGATQIMVSSGDQSDLFFDRFSKSGYPHAVHTSA